MGRRFDNEAAAGGLSYEDAVRALSDALAFGINPSLEPIRAMAEELGHPQDTFACVQVTGTNGKSSAVWATAALLAAHGLRTGAYTSPELHSYNERIACGGAPVSEELFAAAVTAALDAADRAGVTPTEFEIVTAAALWAYRELSVDVAVLEVGMGGRWDATSVVAPAVAVVTGVGIDHSEHLGTTREEIAADKAQMMIANSRLILGPGTAGVEEAFLTRAEEIGIDSRVIRAVRVASGSTPLSEERTVRYAVTAAPEAPDGLTRLDVRGAHADYWGLELCAPRYQAANVASAVAAAEAFLGRALDPERVRETVARMRFPGRFEVVERDPWVVADAAHNPQAATALAEAVRDAWPDPAGRPVVVLGVLADKDAAGIATALAPVAAGFVCVAPRSPRALSASELAATVERVTGEAPEVADSTALGIALARSAGKQAVLTTGSVRMAAEAGNPVGR